MNVKKVNGNVNTIYHVELTLHVLNLLHLFATMARIII